MKKHVDIPEGAVYRHSLCLDGSEVCEGIFIVSSLAGENIPFPMESVLSITVLPIKLQKLAPPR